MALNPRPAFDPLPEPDPPDPDRATEFQALAGQELAGFDEAHDAAATELSNLVDVIAAGEVAVAALGEDLARGAEELAAMREEAAADTLEPDLENAAAADQALGSVGITIASAPTPPAPAPAPAAPEAPATEPEELPELPFTWPDRVLPQ